LPDIREELPILTNRNLVFMQDGAPPHFTNDVKNFLNEEFPRGWIGRGGPIPWPPRSPDITPMDYFIWGYWKELVYKEQINDIGHLRQRIIAAAEIIRQKLTETDVSEGLLRRLQECQRQNGGYFEPRI
jgi:hypothetical protein